MADFHVQILRRTTFAAPAIANQLQIIDLAQLIDTLDWRSGLLIVRVYSNSIAGAGNACLFGVKNSMVSPDDPQTVLLEDPTQADVSIDNTVTAPAVLIRQFYNANAPLIGRYVSVLMAWNAGGTTLSGSVTIGIDLLGRDT